MIHYYRTKKYRGPTFQLLCTDEWVPYMNSVERSFTSVPHIVTCPACLLILIPKAEEKLTKMKLALEQSRCAEKTSG
jgi:hypothetical protein